MTSVTLKESVVGVFLFFFLLVKAPNNAICMKDLELLIVELVQKSETMNKICDLYKNNVVTVL